MRSTEGPSRLITPDEINCQAARVRIVFGGARRDDGETGESSDADRVNLWVTVGLTKVRCIKCNYSNKMTDYSMYLGHCCDLIRYLHNNVC